MDSSKVLEMMNPANIDACIAPFLSDYRITDLFVKLYRKYETVSLLAHGWDHIFRVLKNALRLSDSIKCRKDIIIPASLLHDIGFLYDPDPMNHHEIGAKKSYEWTGAWSAEDRKEIAECIRRHKGNMKGFDIRPETNEQKVVCDADLLEKVGYIGIIHGIRTYDEFAENCWPRYKMLYEIVKHLAELRELEFSTDLGKSIAEERGGVLLRADVYAKARDELRPYLNESM